MSCGRNLRRWPGLPIAEQRTLTDNITNSSIDEIYEAVLESGALGGKLLGAGGEGLRLRNVTGDSPKAMAISGRPFLELLLRQLRRHRGETVKCSAGSGLMAPCPVSGQFYLPCGCS
jgi:hypothetical protein